MKTHSIIAAMAVLGLAAAALTALAGEEPVKKREYKNRQEYVGTIACIGCELEKRGADAQVALHSKHAQGLLGADGTLWTFIDNARGHHLITHKKLLGKEVKVVGWKFPKTQYIEAWSYFIKKGEKWVHWDYCKICGFEPGDHKGTDLCPGCAEDAEEDAKEDK